MAPLKLFNMLKILIRNKGNKEETKKGSDESEDISMGNIESD